VTWRWRTTPEGFVEVYQETGRGFEIIVLDGEDASVRSTREWITLARPIAQAKRVPLSWVLGVIYSESGGKADAENFCCVGLMALNVGVFKERTREGWKDPRANVTKGAELLGIFRGDGWDLPSAASMYNAGPQSAPPHGPKQSILSPWGMVENAGDPWGYIERVVRAQNWFRAELGERDNRASSSSSGSDEWTAALAIAVARWIWNQRG